MSQSGSLISLISLIITVYIWIIVARCVLSFIPHDPSHNIIKLIYDLTDPVLKPIHRIVPMAGGLDFSPLVAILGLELLRNLMIYVLRLL